MSGNSVLLFWMEKKSTCSEGYGSFSLFALSLVRKMQKSRRVGTACHRWLNVQRERTQKPETPRRRERTPHPCSLASTVPRMEEAFRVTCSIKNEPLSSIPIKCRYNPWPQRWLCVFWSLPPLCSHALPLGDQRSPALPGMFADLTRKVPCPGKPHGRLQPHGWSPAPSLQPCPDSGHTGCWAAPHTRQADRRQGRRHLLHSGVCSRASSWEKPSGTLPCPR